jgi:hypothetical protein
MQILPLHYVQGQDDNGKARVTKEKLRITIVPCPLKVEVTRLKPHDYILNLA